MHQMTTPSRDSGFGISALSSVALSGTDGDVRDLDTFFAIFRWVSIGPIGLRYSFHSSETDRS